MPPQTIAGLFLNSTLCAAMVCMELHLFLLWRCQGDRVCYVLCCGHPQRCRERCTFKELGLPQ
eukprot:1256989-Amphidinium_carterae.1